MGLEILLLAGAFEAISIAVLCRVFYQRGWVAGRIDARVSSEANRALIARCRELQALCND